MFFCVNLLTQRASSLRSCAKAPILRHLVSRDQSVELEYPHGGLSNVGGHHMLAVNHNR